MEVRTARASPVLDPVEATPVAKAERREMLLDIAAEMVSSGEIDEASMDAIAERAGVSRPLVYKHFANRHELLAALYQRESAHLYAHLADEVRRADTLGDKLRTLVSGALAAQATRGATFAALAANGLRSPSQLDTRRPGDRQTLRYFTTIAMAELGLDEPTASAA
ncbi:MAG: TetR/AcrR family transcriptional regulator, partial [Acidimicrobiales bacterium]